MTPHIARSVPADERHRYEAWLSSSSISTPDSDEMVIAWSIAQKIGRSPTAVIRAARGQRGQEQLRSKIENFVKRCPDIEFANDHGVRRMRFPATTTDTA